jgi:carbon storage regulator
MLVLSRKPGEKILIGDEVTITVLSVKGNRIRLGIDAPPGCRVLRTELTHLPNEEPASDCFSSEGWLETAGAH